jgi:hypothetical protein
MKYTLLVATDPAKTPAPGSPEESQLFQAFFAFNQEIVDKGVYLGGEPLQDVSTATTIRVVNGQVSATDGPFAETKEQIGGVYLPECADLDEALMRFPEWPCHSYEPLTACAMTLPATFAFGSSVEDVASGSAREDEHLVEPFAADVGHGGVLSRVADRHHHERPLLGRTVKELVQPAHRAGRMGQGG